MLEGLSVVSVENWLSAPLGSRILADLGADVVKVENPDNGDPYRYVNHFYDDDVPPDLTYRFLQVNRGKESLAIDLKSDEGRELFLSIAAKADAVIENLRPGKMVELGLGYEAVRERNEDVIYCSVSGYGQTGPLSDQAAFDASIQARSGIIGQNVADTDEFGYTGIFIADIVGGLYTAMAVQSAFIAKLQGEGGTHVDVSLLDCLLSLFNQEIAEYSAEGSVTSRLQATVVPFNVYETADSAVVLSLFSEDNWAELCRRLGFEEWIEAYPTAKSRQANSQEVDDRIQAVLETAPTEEWQETFADSTIKVIPVNTVQEAFELEQIEQRGAVRDAHHDGIGDYKELPFPVKFSGHRLQAPSPAPRLGEHTAEVLAESGLSPEEIERLTDEHVVGQFETDED